jgi:hypothetical protein
LIPSVISRLLGVFKGFGHFRKGYNKPSEGAGLASSSVYILVVEASLLPSFLGVILLCPLSLCLHFQGSNKKQ